MKPSSTHNFNLSGPWSCVQTFNCEMVGSSVRNNAGIPLEFSGFHARSRFWRLVISKNHGASRTSFHGIEFFGYDCKIGKLLQHLGLVEYEDVFIENVCKYTKSKYLFLTISKNFIA